MPAKKKPPAGCDCVSMVNSQLEPRNTRLVTSLLVSHPTFTTAALGVSAVIATERIENFRDGKRAVVLLPTFCPFCGKKIPKP